MSHEKKARNKKAKKLRKKGLSYRQIARIFGIGVKTAFEVVNR